MFSRAVCSDYEANRGTRPCHIFVSKSKALAKFLGRQFNLDIASIVFLFSGHSLFCSQDFACWLEIQLILLLKALY